MMFSSSTCRLVLLVSAAFNAMASAETPVDLKTAEDFVILTKTGISTVPTSAITGDIAVSPITAAAMTGFNLILDIEGKSSTSTQLAGENKAYAANYLGDTPTVLTTAVGDMETAYTNAAGRPNSDGARINLGAGILGGVFGGATDPLTPGIYTFTTDVKLPNEVHFAGSATDVFIIQIAGNLIQDANIKVILAGGALAKNIFWQVAGTVTVAAGAHMEGILLVKTGVTFITGSSLNGRVLAQTACVLQQATITQPADARRRFLRSS
jgi:hypothetical protein